jgi:hypothetical protein
LRYYPGVSLERLKKPMESLREVICVLDETGT